MDWTALESFFTNPLTAFLAATLLNALGAPRLWVAVAVTLCCPTAWLAFVLSMSSALLGSSLTLVLARRYGREPTRRRLAKYPQLAAFVNQAPDVLIVLLIRQLPVPGLISTLALALSQASFGAFFWGSFLGYLPTTAIVCWVGEAGLHDRSNLTHLGLYIALGVVLLLLLKRAFRLLLRKRKLALDR